MRRNAIYLFFLMALAGCVKQTDWPLPGVPVNLIVVDGILTDERKAQPVRIHYAVTELNAQPVPVSGATVLISHEDSTWTLTEQPLNSGIYYTLPTFIARLEKNYTLQIYIGNRVYTAKAYMVAGTEFQELQYEPGNDGKYHISWVASAFSAEKSAMWEILLDWSKVPGYESKDPETCRAKIMFYTLPTVDVSEVFAPEVEKIGFPAGTIITERRYSLTPEHAAFIREMLLETSWQGGLFPIAPANVSTNLSQGAAGYFGVSAMTFVSIIVK